MYAAERQRIIVDLTRRNERVAVTELADQFEVTTETIRRDLDSLDQRGLLRRVHGGAVLAAKVVLSESDLADREPAHAAQKAQIAAAASAFFPGPEGSILLDSGTTTRRLVSMITGQSAKVLVTNSVAIAAAVHADSLSVRMIGGRVRGLTGATVGGEAVSVLAALRCDVAFVGTNGVSVRHGFSTPDPDEAAVKTAMVGSAKKVVALADSSKIGVECFVSFAPLAQVDVMITDSGISPDDQRALRDAGVQVVIA